MYYTVELVLYADNLQHVGRTNNPQNDADNLQPQKMNVGRTNNPQNDN